MDKVKIVYLWCYCEQVFHTVKVSWTLEAEEDMKEHWGLDLETELQTEIDKFVKAEFQRIHPEALCEVTDLPLVIE